MTASHEGADALTAPAASSIAITPSNSVALSTVTKALYIGTGGDITLRLVADSTDRLFKNIPGGSILDLRATHVRATGTTAADIVGLL